ncbi:hypothetical protein HDU67_008853 [Dinochytrium kinnereticum]|nr:hypothetical protein HDU67_008853 [Dinochytrium kinnereticum]
MGGVGYVDYSLDAQLSGGGGLGPNTTSSNGGGTMAPSRSLWIGNIDPNLSPADLLATFSPFGPIESLRILPERECAFVNYVRTEDAILARESLQGSRLSGAPSVSGNGASLGSALGGNGTIKIGFGKVEAIGDTQGMQPTKSLWIGNIPPTTDPAELEVIFSAFGPIESARVLTHKNCGFVNFDKLEDAMEARKSMNGREIGGSVVKIGYAKVPGKGGAGADGLSVQFGAPSSLPVPPGATAQGISTSNGGISAIDVLGESGNGDSSDSNFQTSSDDDEYAMALSPLPEPLAIRKIDQSRLREMRKRLEGHVPPKEVEAMFNEVLPETVDLCTDYIGNVVIQKIMEKSPENHRLALIEQVAPHMAVIGVHKNGTWVVQKMIDLAKTPAQMNVIVNSLKRYAPPLLLDQFGNYVVQCCLRLGPQKNQFIFDAMHTKCLDVGFGRFGARAIRACLESQFTTKRQQKHVAMAIVQNAAQLVTNPNGAILITWLLDTSSLPGRYRVIAPKLAPFVAAFCNHKLASSTILKLVNQRIELDAREIIVKEIFFKDEGTLREILSDLAHGVSTIQKILATACVTPEERVRLADRVRMMFSRIPEVQENPVGFKRLLDELAAIPSSLTLGALDASSISSHDIVSPLTPHAGFFANPLGPPGPGYYTGPGGHPTPNHSPQQIGLGGAPGYMPYTTSPNGLGPQAGAYMPASGHVVPGYSPMPPSMSAPPWGMGQPGAYGLHPYHATVLSQQTSSSGAQH